MSQLTEQQLLAKFGKGSTEIGSKIKESAISTAGAIQERKENIQRNMLILLNRRMLQVV